MVSDNRFVPLVGPWQGLGLDLSWCRPYRADLSDALPLRPDIPTTIVQGTTEPIADYTNPAPYTRQPYAPSTAMYLNGPRFSPSGHYLPPEQLLPYPTPLPPLPSNVVAFPGRHEHPDNLPSALPGWEPLTPRPDETSDAGLAATVGQLSQQVQALQALIVENIVPALARTNQVPVAPPVPAAPVVYRDVQRTVVRNRQGKDTVVASTEEVIMVDPVTGSRNRETTTTTTVGTDGRTIHPDDRISTCITCQGFLTSPRQCRTCQAPLCPHCARYTVNKETEDVKVYCPNHAPSGNMGFFDLLAAGFAFLNAFFS